MLKIDDDLEGAFGEEECAVPVSLGRAVIDASGDTGYKPSFDRKLCVTKKTGSLIDALSQP